MARVRGVAMVGAVRTVEKMARGAGAVKEMVAV